MADLIRAIRQMNPSGIASALQNEDVLPNMGSHKVILLTRLGPAVTAVRHRDLCVVKLKSDFVYDEMLKWADAIDEADREKWYSLCKGMGPMGAGLAGFLFEGFAIRHTSGNYSTTNKHTPFHRFARMAKVEGKGASKPIRFVYQTKDKLSRMIIVTSGDKITLRFFSSSALPEVAQGDLSVAPWRHRERLTYDKIEDIILNDSSYYCPHRHNNPLFDAFFFSVEDGRVVLWILQMTIARMHDGAPSGFDLVRSLRKRASDVWKEHLVEVKYVLVAPHVNANYHVEWNFAAEFEDQKGEVYVQFLNVSTFQRNDGTVCDILGVSPEEATEIGGGNHEK